MRLRPGAAGCCHQRTPLIAAATAAMLERPAGPITGPNGHERSRWPVPNRRYTATVAVTFAVQSVLVSRDGSVEDALCRDSSRRWSHGGQGCWRRRPGLGGPGDRCPRRPCPHSRGRISCPSPAVFSLPARAARLTDELGPSAWSSESATALASAPTVVGDRHGAGIPARTEARRYSHFGVVSRHFPQATQLECMFYAGGSHGNAADA